MHSTLPNWTLAVGLTTICLFSTTLAQDSSNDGRPPQLQSELPLDQQAEVHSDESLEPLASVTVATNSSPATTTRGDYPSGGSSTVETSPNLLNSETPDWVKDGLVLGDEHRLAISSSLLPDLAQCEEDLKSRMMSEVRSYLDKHVLNHTNASQLLELTPEYVEKYWVVPNRVFDNVQDRPSGTYHQKWVELQLSAEQLDKVRSWERTHLRERRTKQIGVLGGAGIAGIALFSGLIGLLARREKAKLKG
jgi:hypothetical protein